MKGGVSGFMLKSTRSYERDLTAGELALMANVLKSTRSYERDPGTAAIAQSICRLNPPALTSGIWSYDTYAAYLAQLKSTRSYERDRRYEQDGRRGAGLNPPALTSGIVGLCAGGVRDRA